tara:strand:+ start:721 stop:1689 length:969 start_codon:yes stop_codon:yes gene_type:complete
MKDSDLTKKNYSSIIILLLIIALGYTGYLISNLNKENHDISKELSNLLLENNDMNQILLNEDVLASSKTRNLKDNLKLMLSSYDSLEQSNTMVVDSIDQQRMKIKNLISKVEKLNGKSKRDWREIFSLKKEAETLRGIMKGYISTIDSLNTLNINLSNSLTEKTNIITKVSTQNTVFKKQNKDLRKKVALGAVLQANNITVSAIRIRNSGSQGETTRAAKTNMVKACFSLLENKLSKAGDKDVYIRVIDQSNQTLVSEKPIIINDSNGENIRLSSKRTINYQNESMDICIYHEIVGALIAGNFKVEIYNDGFLIGKSSFALR